MTVTQSEERVTTPGQPRRPRKGLGLFVAVFTVVLWLGIGGAFGAIGSKLVEVTQSGAAGYLPDEAESARALEISERFTEEQTLPAVVVYKSDGGLSRSDRAAIRDDVGDIRDELDGALAGPPIGPIFADGGEVAQVIVPLAGAEFSHVADGVERLEELMPSYGGPDAYITGPAGIQADMKSAVSGIDIMLIAITATAILIILVLVYRSPLLPFLVLAVAGMSLGAARGVIYLLAERDLVALGEEVQGIINVLVLGAATDYALLLVSRFREELGRYQDRFDAMRAAWRSSAGPIVASAGTVALGLLCLLVSDLSLNSDLGPVAAIGVACALIAMLTFMPAVLVLFGRVAFWPFRPAAAAEQTQKTGGWARWAEWVHRRPRPIWIGTAVVLGIFALGALRLDADGIPQSELVIGNPKSAAGQEILAESFPAGGAAPTVIITDADTVSTVVETVRDVNGVDSAVPFSGGAAPAGSGASIEPMEVDGWSRVDVVLDAPPDSDEAMATVQALRGAVDGVSGAEAKVGGYTAIELDFNQAAERDRIVIPLLLAVVLLVLVVLLRAIVAPLLLLATVVLSFFAAIGVSGIVFQGVFGFPGVESTYILHSFVFLVALGIDYNIFLMTRVREEVPRLGTKRGTVSGLALTGGVITSAGVVLAATFSALAVIPLIMLVELAFTVAFGVLLDTLVVRSLLVPALTVDVGRWMWWPSRLARKEYK